MIEAKQLKKIYGKAGHETHALRGVDVKINEGEFVAIVGKSGAGKSTLMYQLSLLDIPTSGELFLNGEDTSTFSNAVRTRYRLFNLGYVFQDYALLPELSATENVMVPLLMQGFASTPSRKKAHEVLARLGLNERLDNRPSQLSGGEQQRVSIARAIAHNPLVLFADEPTANLDTATSTLLLTYLEELNNAGQTIIMVTHELEYARMAKRVLELSDGALVNDGTPTSVLKSKR